MLNGNAQGGNRQDGLDRVFNQGQIIVADRLLERAAAHGNMSNDERAEGQGFDTVEAQAEMGSSWGDIAVDALYLAADIAMIGEPDNNEKQKPKVVHERKRGQKKKQIQAFFESEKGRKEYEEWKAEQAVLKAQTADKTA